MVTIGGDQCVIRLIVVAISQWTHVSKHHTVCLKYIYYICQK